MLKKYNTLPHVTLIGTVILICACILPWIPFVPQLGATSRLPAYANLGAWFQGILTPAALTVAIISFHSQTKASERQTASQNEANRIANRTFFIANADRLVQHLAYRCLCAIVNGTPKDVTFNNKKITGKILNAMSNLFRGFSADTFMDPVPQHEIYNLEEIRCNEHYIILKHDIDDIILAATDAKLLTLLDNRIERIRRGIIECPPIASI